MEQIFRVFKDTPDMPDNADKKVRVDGQKRQKAGRKERGAAEPHLKGGC